MATSGDFLLATNGDFLMAMGTEEVTGSIPVSRTSFDAVRLGLGVPADFPYPMPHCLGGGPTAVVDPGHAPATPGHGPGAATAAYTTTAAQNTEAHAGPLSPRRRPWPAVTAPTHIHEGRRPAVRLQQ
jgi:hypothetical protein